jgi:transcriptional regulator with XRE-family HTH domain
MNQDDDRYTRDPLIRTFGAVLRSHRETAGLSRAQLAEALGCTGQWIETLERGNKPPSEATAEDLDVYFKTGPARTFWTMWLEIKREGRHLILPPGFAGFMEREAEASVLYIFEISVITGILQTPEYAYEILKSGRTTEEIEELVAKRMERQEILTGQNPPQIVAVFDENAVRRMIGDHEVMRNQIRHLIEMAERPNITVQIVPNDKGSYAGLPGAFTVLGYEDEPDVVYREGYTTGQLTNDPDEIREYTRFYNLIRGAAISADETLKLLGEILESL